ncbi:MAG TPA: hypothetical protein VIR00_06185 [Micromonosporaceae bacterium]
MADEAVAVTLARIEAKLDAVISGHEDHEKRLRALEVSATASGDHGARLTALEANRWPLPALGAVIAIAALIVAIWKG